ncbi:MAG: hemerythrin domain-containing protein [Proteobacteria bacterium]|nr:MAG: hemerythrin domain-containing protein [Pseudomonadota bacterium]
MVDALRLIHQDHVNLDKVLSVLLEVGGSLPDQRSETVSSLLADAIYYIEVFPERFHHPKEEKLLFPLVRKLRPELNEVIDKLSEQHTQGERAIAELAAAVKRLEGDWAANRETVQDLVRTYVDAQWEHMRLEEREILKPIRQTLTKADFLSLNSAYGVSNDPLFGENLGTGFDALLRRITR